MSPSDRLNQFIELLVTSHIVVQWSCNSEWFVTPETSSLIFFSLKKQESNCEIPKDQKLKELNQLHQAGTRNGSYTNVLF